MAGKSSSGGKGSKKYGRKKNRSPAQARYTADKRWIKNKRRRAQRTANRFGHPVKIKVEGKWESVSPERSRARRVG